MTVLARWWCCSEYGRTGRQHDADCEYALLGDRADVLVQVKAECARLAHQQRGAVDLLREVMEPHDTPCRYDHHDLCQAHYLHERPCPYERARAFLGGQ